MKLRESQLRKLIRDIIKESNDKNSLIKEKIAKVFVDEFINNIENVYENINEDDIFYGKFFSDLGGDEAYFELYEPGDVESSLSREYEDNRLSDKKDLKTIRTINFHSSTVLEIYFANTTDLNNLNTNVDEFNFINKDNLGDIHIMPPKLNHDLDPTIFVRIKLPRSKMLFDKMKNNIKTVLYNKFKGKDNLLDKARKLILSSEEYLDAIGGYSIDDDDV